MRNLFVGVSLLAFLAFPINNAFAAKDDLDDLRSSGSSFDGWRVIKKDRLRDIITYDKRDVGKSIRSFKVEYEVDNVSLDDIARVYFDFEKYPKWYFEVQDVKLLRKISPTEFYYYIVHRAPAPLPSRDVIWHATIKPYSATQKHAILSLVAEPNYLPEKPPLVRAPEAFIEHKWIPLSHGRMRSETIGYFDPGGIAPDWAVNYVQRRGPYQTTLGLLRMLRQEAQSKDKTPLIFSLSE